MAEGQRERIGVFDCEFVAVNHSIPDALAVAIRTPPAGMAVATGDFKMDQLPLDGRLTDLHAFARLSEEGIDLLLSDSTNAEVPGFVPPERDIQNVLRNVFANAQKRIIVASFASHVHRIQQILDTAHEYGRRVAFVGGRSMVRNMGIARDLGYLKVPRRSRRRRQDPGRPAGRRGRARVHRFAGRADGGSVPHGQPRPPDPHRPGRHRHPGLVADPGGERERGLPRDQRPLPLGRQRRPQGNAKVHVSGHASAGELLYFYNICRPKNLMPVHGEWRHLRANAELGALTGVPKDHIVIAEDGVVVDLIDGKAKIVGKVQAGYVYVDGLSVGDVTETSLKDRRILGDEGIISVFLVVDSTSGKIVGGPPHPGPGGLRHRRRGVLRGRAEDRGGAQQVGPGRG